MKIRKVRYNQKYYICILWESFYFDYIYVFLWLRYLGKTSKYLGYNDYDTVDFRHHCVRAISRVYENKIELSESKEEFNNLYKK